MPDNLSTSITASSMDRKRPQLDAMRGELDSMLEAQNQPKAVAPAAGAPTVPHALTPESSNTSVVGEVNRAVYGAARDAAQNTLDLSTDITNWTSKNLLGLRGELQGFQLPKVDENKTTAGKVSRTVLQFVLPFLGATKVLGNLAPAAGTIKRGMAAGVATDAVAFDPHEKRVSNMVLDMAGSDPFFGRVAFEYLAANPADSNAEGRFKNAVEGMGIGLAVEGLFKGLRIIKSHYTGKGQDPAESVRKAAEAAKKEADEVATKEATQANSELDVAARAKDDAKAMPLRDQIDLITGAGKKAGAQYGRRLDAVAAVKEHDKAVKFVPAEPSTTLRDQIDNTTGVTRESDGAGKRADVAAAVADEAPADKFARIGADIASGKTHRAMWDESDGSIVFTKEAPKPGELPLEQRIQTALGKVAHERNADDLVVLRAYRQLQDSAFPGIAKAGADATPSGKPVSASDDIAAAIREKDLEIARLMSKPQNSALTDPSTLAQMAAAPAAGGTGGFLSADSDSPMDDKIALGIGAALAVWGIKTRVGKNKVLTPAEKHVVDNAHPHVQSLAREEVAGIAPKTVLSTPKVVPTFKSAKVTEMVNLAKSGDYRAVAAAMKESDFNFNNIDTPDDVKAMVDGFSSVFEKETSLATHGKQSFEQTKELAEELGAGKETMKSMYEGTDNLAARVLAHRSLLAASAEKVTSLARLASTGDAEGILALRKHVALHASIQAQMKGVQSEIARALGQFRITAKSVDLSINERNDLIEAMGGHKLNIEFAQKLSDIVDAKKLNAVVRRGAMARTKDSVFEAWINGLLSSPATHVVNTIGNTLTALNSVAERGTASMIGKYLRQGDDAIQAGEVKAQLFGMVEGLKDAVSITAEGLAAMRKAAGQAVTGDLKGASSTLSENTKEFGGMWEAAATNAPVLDNAAFSTMDHGARGASLTADAFDMDPNSLIGSIVDGLGALVRLPGRALMTSDELFKTIHYRGELKAQAYRKARSEGLEGDALFTRIGNLIEDPTPELAAQSLDAARKGTFTSPLGSMGSSGQHYLNQVPGARYVMPFVRTPINLMKYVGVRTPGLNMLAESVRTEFKAGGTRRDIMMAKTATGGALYALGATLAAQGIITGGGEKDQSAEKIGGWQPNSVLMNGTYYSFNRLDPFGTFLGLSAAMSDISGHIGTDKADEIASMSALAISRNLVSKQYLSGMVDFLDTVNSGSEHKWQKFMQRFAGSFVPAGVAAVRREVDPEVKEVWSVVDAVKARVPGMSKDIPPLVNIFGEDVHYKGGLGPDIASPVYTSEKSTEPAAAEIARLNIDLRHPPRTIAAVGGGKGIDLTPKQYTKYMKLIGNDAKVNGKGFKDYMTHLVQTDHYKKLPDDPDNNTYQEPKEMMIKRVYESYKKVAQARLISEDPELKQMYIQNQKNVGNALSGKPVLQFQ